MGLREARTRFIRALRDGDFDYAARPAQAEKNLLSVGEVSVDEIVEVLKCCRGGDYRESPHHFDAATIVHQFTPRVTGERWYIKGYFKDMTLIVISVHRSE